MEGDVIESIAARIRFATGCSYSTSVEAAAISVNLLKPSHDESKNRIADLEARLATAEAEVGRLNQWADGMADIALKERATGEAYQRELRDKIADLEARCAELKAALNDAIESIEDWAGYASEYFRQKHGLAEEVARLKALTEGGDHG